MIDQTVTIKNANAKDIYDILLDSKLHSRLTGGKATIDPVVGGIYSTFDGYADGQILKLEPGKLIEQTWRADDWSFDEYSTIKFELADNKDGVIIHFTQKDIPKGREKEYESGWQDFYWTPLKDLFSDHLK